MDSFKDVLEAAQAYCKTQMAEPTYNLYIDGLEPISFEDSSHITLSVRNDFICKIVTDRYLGLLKEAFKTVLGFDVDITLVVPSTPPHEVVLAQQYEANPASPQGNYEFTFENFIKGPSNQFAFAAAQAVAANPSGAYNPLFIYGGSAIRAGSTEDFRMRLEVCTMQIYIWQGRIIYQIELKTDCFIHATVFLQTKHRSKWRKNVRQRS